MSERTSSGYIYYALKLYSSGLSLRKTSQQQLSLLIKRNHVSIYLELDSEIQSKEEGIAKQKEENTQEFIIDETLIKVNSDYVWIWIAIEPTYKTILGIRTSFERNMLVAEQFLKSLVKKYGKHHISTDGGTWYPQACKFLKLKHHTHLPYEKSII